MPSPLHPLLLFFYIHILQIIYKSFLNLLKHDFFMIIPPPTKKIWIEEEKIIIKTSSPFVIITSCGKVICYKKENGKQKKKNIQNVIGTKWRARTNQRRRQCQAVTAATEQRSEAAAEANLDFRLIIRQSRVQNVWMNGSLAAVTYHHLVDWLWLTGSKPSSQSTCHSLHVQ